MIDIIGKRRLGYLTSAILVGVGLLFILATLIPNGGVGLQFSIAYTGGTVWEVHFEGETPDPVDVRAVLEEQGLTGEVAITTSDDKEYVLIRTEALSIQDHGSGEGEAEASVDPSESPEPAVSESPESTIEPVASVAPEASAAPEEDAAAVADDDAEPPADDVAGVPTSGQFGELATALQDEFGVINEVRQENSVGPVVSQELIWQTLTLVLFAALAIMAWVAYRFRDFRMGITALTALLHDVIIVVGIFAVLGTVIGLRIDALFVTAMLTVIGYSVHDTIVVFDRIRENRQRYVGEPLVQVVNHSLVQTIGRSLTTSLTLIVTLMALMLFGGDAIRAFTLALLIGVVAGTYSSIFVATPLFLDWHLWDDRRKANRPPEPKAKASARSSAS